MNIADWFRREFLDAVEAAESIVHTVEKEITMSLPQPITDALNFIKQALADHSNQNAALQQQVADLTAAGQAKDSQITDLSSQLAAAQADLADLENQLLAIAGSAAPAPAPVQPPADGSGSADVQP